MSGSNVWKIRFTTEGADQVVRDLRELSTQSAAGARAYDALIKAQPQLASGAERAEQALRKNVDAMRSMRGEYGQGATAIDAVTSSMGRFGSALTSPAAAIAALSAGVGAGAVQIAKLGDEYTNTMNKLTAATGSAGAATRVYAELAAMSQQTGASISESAGAFVRFSVAARAIGATNGEVLQLTRTIQQAGLISGASTQEAASGVQQLGQALASGTLQGDELRSILENMAPLAEGLARELGVGIGQLRQMGSEGKLTSEVVFPALLRLGVQINQQFTELTPTMGRAFGILGQSMVDFVGKLDQALGLSQAIARAATAAAAGVRAVGNLGAARSPGEQAQFEIGESEQRRAGISSEIARLESGATPTSRRGSTSRAMQEAAGQHTGREARLAELRASLAEEVRLTEAAQLRIITVESESDRAQFAEQQQANERRLTAQRTAQTASFNTVQTALDRERTARTAHATRVAAIDAGLANGDTDAAGAARLRTLADAELASGLQERGAAATGAARADRSGAAASRESADADRARDAVRREGEGVTRSVRTELEKYADEVVRLDGLLASGAITQGTYNRAVAAADPAIRAATEAARQIEQQNTRMTDSITGFFGNAFARAFEGTANGFRGLMDSFRRAAISTFATIASQAIIRPIIAPIVSALGLGGLTGGSGGGFNLAGLFGGGTAQAATPGAATGGGVGLGTISSGLGIGQRLMNLGSSGGLGSFFPGGASVNTGFGFADGLLNTSLFASSNAGGAVTNAAGFGSMAANSIDVAGSAVSAGVSPGAGLSVAGSLGPLAAIGGGAFGIYSGIQKGGIGGAVGGLGGAVSAATGVGMLGAAAGLLPALGVLGPIGLALGAALALAGAFLPGQKASGKGQWSGRDLFTGSSTSGGLGGNRFSQGNADAASGQVNKIYDLAQMIGQKLGGVEIGGGIAVGVTSSRGSGPGTLYLDIDGRKAEFTNDEDGAKKLAEESARMILAEFREQGRVEGDRGSILNASGDDIARLGENLDWYETVYKVFTQTADVADKMATAVAAVEAQFTPLISKAQELGLSTDKMVEARDKEVAATRKAVDEAEAARVAELSGLRSSIQSRIAASQGTDNYEARLIAGQVARVQAWAGELRELEARLTALGETSEATATQIAAVTAAQGAQFWRDFATTMESLDQAVNSRIVRARGDTGSADIMDFERAAIEQTRALSLALSELGVSAEIAAQKIGENQTAIDAEREAARSARQRTLEDMDAALKSRILRADGRGADADSAEFERSALLEMENLRKALFNLGATASTTADFIVLTEAAISKERIANQKAVAEAAVAASRDQLRQMLQAGQSIRGFVDAHRANSGPGGVSTAQALTAAQSQFGVDLAFSRAGDQDALARITSTADRLLQAGQNQFASGVDFQAIRNFVLASLETLPATRSYDALILEELKKLGGAVDVSVAVAVVRTITEALSALPSADQLQLIQPETILRTVEDRLGRALTAAERATLIDSGLIARIISQGVQAPTGAAVIAAGVIDRTIRQAVETTETVQISRSIDNILRASLDAQVVLGQAQLVELRSIARESAASSGTLLVHQPAIYRDLNNLWLLALGINDPAGFRVSSASPLAGAASSITRFAKGGVFDGPVLFPMHGGTGMMGEAGPEAIMPLDRGPDGKLGVRSRGQGMDLGGLVVVVRELRREIAMLRSERATDARRMIIAGERTADATEDAAGSNAKMARGENGVVGRRSAA